MTTVLVLGGTGWLSGRIARRWADAGASVTCLGRGVRPSPAGTTLVPADRDAPLPYRPVADAHWDEVIDVTRHARHARDAVGVLGARAGRWTFVSSVSVYADDRTPDADETAPLHGPAERDDEDYAAQKVGAEQAVRTLGDRARIVRPGLIVGQGDPSDRFGYWAAAFDRAGDRPVLVPQTADRWTQVIDVDDLAAFLVADRGHGVLNAVGNVHPLGDVLDMFRAATSHTGDLVPADDAALEAAGIAYWAGERSLPLWLPADMDGHGRRSNAAFRAAGGTLAPLRRTIEAVVRDERMRGTDRLRSAGLTRAQEQEVIDRLRT